MTTPDGVKPRIDSTTAAASFAHSNVSSSDASEVGSWSGMGFRSAGFARQS
jgi:hypothetical protein